MSEKFTKEMVDDYADKLLIGLTDEENKMVLDEFAGIDKNIDLINEKITAIISSDGDIDYVYITANNTIFGTEYADLPEDSSA